MIRPLLENEWRALVRDGRGKLILTLGVLLALVATWTASSTDARERAGQTHATDEARSAWLERDADHPHSRAHYGDYVFRPSGPLAGLDSGLQMATGRAVRVEAHYQNAAVHTPQREASVLLRFDRLEPSTVLQLLAPLIVILIGFGAISSERESGRLKLLRIQGARPLPLLLAKSFALWTVGAVVCLFVIGAHLLFAEGAEVGRTLAFAALHLAVLAIVSVLVTCISATFRRPGTAAAVLLCLWVCGGILLPRVAAMTAGTVHPLPDRDAFQAAMREDREQGLDGHNPRDARRLEYEQKVLAENGVESKEDLPFNLDGILMQADEDYGNQVWDEHFGRLEERMLRQSAFAALFSVVNPLQVADRVSMAIAGTDLRSNLAFLRQAEDYRRQLVKSLNDEHAYGGSLTGERAWRPEKEFYAGFASFEYRPPALATLLGAHRLELLSLGLWGIGAVLFLGVSARRLEQGGGL